MGGFGVGLATFKTFVPRVKKVLVSIKGAQQIGVKEHLQGYCIVADQRDISETHNCILDSSPRIFHKPLDLILLHKYGFLGALHPNSKLENSHV